jgi:hypothetical protein
MWVLEAGGSLRALWCEFMPAHRRWIYLNALLATAVINLAVNAAIAWVSVIGERRVPLWSVPLVDKPSTITDTIGTLFMLPLITCLLCTTAVWHDIATGRLPPLNATPGVQALVARLPRSRLRRGFRLGALLTIALTPVTILVLVMVDFANLTAAQFVLYKAAFSIALGMIVTPVIAMLAIASSPAQPITTKVDVSHPPLAK